MSRGTEKIKMISRLNGKYQYPMTHGSIVVDDNGDQWCEQGAEENTIETVKVNGTALTPDANKAVNIELSQSEQIQSDWEQSDNTKKDFIKNKPTIPSISGLESASNKVTAFQSTPDDTHYPSEKLVKDSLDTKQGTIDSTHKLSADLVQDGTTNKVVTSTEKSTWSGKQDALVSGTNIKTINNESLLGSGNITVGGGTATDVQVNGTSITSNNVANIVTEGTYNASTNKIATMSDLPSVPVTDVTVGGTSVVSSGTAVIPAIPDTSNLIAKSSTAGLVKNDGTIDTNTYITSAHEVPSGGNAGQVLAKNSATDYDLRWTDQTQNYPSAYCTTSGSTASKKANCSLYVTQANQYLQVLMGSANTYQGALTLNINSAGAKPIYINGTASSATNYTLPNGTYFVFYDGTNYYFRTDGRIPGLGNSYTALVDDIPTISTDIQTDKTSTTKTASPSAVYSEVHPTTGSSQPAGGMLPNVLYKLGTLSGSVSIALASPSDNTICNHYYFTFDADSTAPTITWDAAITSWNGGSAPTITASKHYEISVLDGVATFMEV